MCAAMHARRFWFHHTRILTRIGVSSICGTRPTPLALALNHYHTSNINKSQYNNNNSNSNTNDTTTSSTEPQSSTTTSRVVRSSSSHYGTFNRGRIDGSASTQTRSTARTILHAPEQTTAQTLTDVDTVFNNARLAIDEYRRRVDTDADSAGNTPSSLRQYITKLQTENKTTAQHSNSDFTLNDSDLELTDIVDSTRPLRGKRLHTERLISRLRQEQSLQERLSLLDEYGRPSLLKREPVQRIDSAGRSHGYGRRKSAHAHVYIKPNPYNNGEIIVNQQRYVKYFQRFAHRATVVRPLLSTNMFGEFDIVVRTYGGGHTGQADATKLAIARALQHYEPLLRESLKEQFLLTRDPRVVERKKFGRYKARKGYTYVRR